MGDRHANPNDRVDLSVLAPSFGDTLPTLYPVAHVYAPRNPAGNVVEVSGSPFTLISFGNNLYGLEGAFQADVSSGTYKVIYIFYTNAAHTVNAGASLDIGESHETITISIQSTTGLGSNGGGGDFYYDDKATRKLINGIVKRMDKLQKDFDAGLKIEVPINGAQIIEAVNSKKFSYGEILDAIASKTFDDSTILSAIKDKGFDDSGVIEAIKKKTFDNSKILKAIDDKKFDEKNILSSIKDKYDKLIVAIKKNRSTTIKYKFDKSQITPIAKNVADTNLKLTKDMHNMKVDLTRTIDMKNETTNEFIKILIDNNIKKFTKLFNLLGEDIRLKLKYIFEEFTGQAKKNFKKLEPKKPKYKSNLFDEKE